jgi:hypothetical protein
MHVLPLFFYWRIISKVAADWLILPNSSALGLASIFILTNHDIEKDSF